MVHRELTSLSPMLVRHVLEEVCEQDAVIEGQEPEPVTYLHCSIAWL